MSFVANANDGWFDCGVYSLLGVPDMYTTWKPDPVGPDGSTMEFFVSQTLTDRSTISTQLFFAFTDESGTLISHAVHPVDENITVVQDTYNVVVPKYLPPVYTVTVVIKDYNRLRHCVSFKRASRSPP
ncbi:hypothetical protein F8M41_025173 [Gigaspora margarita]|uniref:Uncharacterized protein n=1 Tax=Gigaspora margarita TaxID=4874 RepID=A0A8H3XJK3_GIGMA|nr:hypothetical protein F8M41_025173 [Gigaspora margarita]